MGGGPRLPARFHVSRSTSDPAQLSSGFMYGAFTLSGRTFQTVPLPYDSLDAVHNPGTHALQFRLPSISLAATLEIEFSFFSSPCLDVSVQAVPDVWLWIHHTTTEVLLSRVSPFRDLRIKGYLLLPEAYRSLSRLSSALGAKASTLRSLCQSDQLR